MLTTSLSEPLSVHADRRLTSHRIHTYQLDMHQLQNAVQVLLHRGRKVGNAHGSSLCIFLQRHTCACLNQHEVSLRPNTLEYLACSVSSNSQNDIQGLHDYS